MVTRKPTRRGDNGRFLAESVVLIGVHTLLLFNGPLLQLLWSTVLYYSFRVAFGG